MDIPDILPLCEALTRTEINLANTIENYCKQNDLHVITISRYDAISKVIIDEYGQQEFLRKLSDPLWFQELEQIL